MWSVVIGGIVKVVDGWFTTKRAKQEAEAQYHMALAKGEQDWDIMAMKNSQFSWKDEFITIIWYSPIIIGWFEKRVAPTGEVTWHMRDANEWAVFVGNLPVWYQVGMFGILAASFGLRWFMKQQGLQIKK